MISEPNYRLLSYVGVIFVGFYLPPL